MKTRTSSPRTRSPRAVFQDHLRLRRQGRLEDDLKRNYTEDVVLLTSFGVFRGKEGVRQCAALLREDMPCPRYRYQVRLVEGEVAFLKWSARCPQAEIEDGADTFLIRDGQIVVQTIHYTVHPLSGGVSVEATSIH